MDIDSAISGVTNISKTKKSKERTKQGRLLYSPKELNAAFKEQFGSRGFVGLVDRYSIQLPSYPLKITGAYKQIDFFKSPVLVEVQFGKYFAMFYDLAKFQYFFNENKAEVGVEIVPCHGLHKQMSSGVSYGEQLIYDIWRLRKHFPAVPVKIILIDFEDALPLKEETVDESGHVEIEGAG